MCEVNAVPSVMSPLLRRTDRGLTLAVTIAVAAGALALWMCVAWGDGILASRPGIAAIMLSGLFAVMLPLALRAQLSATTWTRDELCCRGVLARHRVRWDDVASVDPGRLVVRTRDGRWFELPAPRGLPAESLRGDVAAVMERWLAATGDVPPIQSAASRAPVRRTSDGTRLAAVTAAAFVLIGIVMIVGHNAVAARFGEGTRGSFDVLEVFCAPRCTWSGLFDSGRPPWLNDIALAPGPGQTLSGAGHRVPAIDVGDQNQVYPPGGGSQWAQIKAITIAISAVALCLIACVLGLRYRRSWLYRRARPGPRAPR